MVKFVLIRPGSTDFDEQGRIQGTLDIPLNEHGSTAVGRTGEELRTLGVSVVYGSCCQAAWQTASGIAKTLGVRAKRLEKLQNLDHGLWQGMLIDDVKRRQPRVYRQWQEQPQTICPPEGEMLSQAQERVEAALSKLLKKHKDGTIALVVPEPLASLVSSYLTDSEIGDLWTPVAQRKSWEVISVGPDPLMHRGVKISNGKTAVSEGVLPNRIS